MRDRAIAGRAARADSPCKRPTHAAQSLKRDWKALLRRASERVASAVLTKVRGMLQTVSDESVTLLIEPFEIEVQVPEQTRRLLQSRLGEPIALYTILYIEGGAMVARLLPRLVGF